MEFWIIPCFFILLMQAGFGLLQTGMCRARNGAHTLSMNLLGYALGVTAFWAVGFALMFGGGASPAHSAGSWGRLAEATGLRTMFGQRIGGHWWGMAGSRGFFLASRLDPAAYQAMLGAFLCMMLYMSVALAIPIGALAERWRFKSFAIFAVLTAGVIFPIFGCWVWGGGWLAQLGKHLRLGNGAVDYAGSSVVHLLGGTLALAGVWRIGPRIGKYDAQGRPRPISRHSVPMILLGTMLLAFAWFGFNTAHSFAARDGRALVVAVNTALASVAGTLAAALYLWNVHRKPDASLMCNGMLGALAASGASCAYIAPWAAFLIGALGGLFAAWGVRFLERRGVDDPVGAVSVHGFNGLWGMIALGLFADGTFGAGTHGVARAVRGLFYGGGAGQLYAQLIASAVCIAWALGAGSLIFALLRLFLGTNRVPPEVEIAGLDIAEPNASGCPAPVSDLEQIPASEIAAARRG